MSLLNTPDEQPSNRMKPQLVNRIFVVWGALVALLPLWPESLWPETRVNAAERTYDVVVYGGTSGAVVAAVHAARAGRRVALVSPDEHLGGLSSGGLGWTDTGNKAVIGGVSREFYHRVWQHYQQDDTWRWQTRQQYGNRGQGTKAIDGEQRTMWIFEPHVAEAVFDEMVAAEKSLDLYRDHWLDREAGVVRKGRRIVSIRTLDGDTFRGRIFVDATYEGDLLAAAGVSYHVGREANSQYGEKWNGVQVGVLHHRHHFMSDISPYKIAGDPDSGLLPGVSGAPPGEYGTADKRIQAYCFRMCLTNHPANRIPFPKPADYDPADYELLRRVLVAGWREHFSKFDPIPNHKTDTNNHGPFSTDNIGMNYDYPEASYERRREIIAQHESYQKGLMYYLANDPGVPAEVREAVAKWGLAADEFEDNGHWPHQLYIREARRMIGEFVMTENELLKRTPTPHSIGMGSYTMDSHNVQRYVKPDGFVQNEGDIGVSTGGPYEIALGSILPQRDQCENLLVPVCVSSSHIAFGSIRMEPVFMILGHSAATLADMAIEADVPVQAIEYGPLRKRLLSEGQVLEWEGDERRVLKYKLPGIVLEAEDAEKVGHWSPSASAGRWVGSGYLHDSNTGGGGKVIFKTTTKGATFDIRVAYSAHANRASNVPIVIKNGSQVKRVTLNQRKKPAIDDLFQTIARLDLSGQVEISISNEGADGYVIVDAVQLLPVD